MLGLPAQAMKTKISALSRRRVITTSTTSCQAIVPFYQIFFFKSGGKAHIRAPRSPTNTQERYICKAEKSARRANRDPSPCSMLSLLWRRSASSHITITPAKKASTAGRTSLRQAKAAVWSWVAHRASRRGSISYSTAASSFSASSRSKAGSQWSERSSACPCLRRILATRLKVCTAAS